MKAIHTYVMSARYYGSMYGVGIEKVGSAVRYVWNAERPADPKHISKWRHGQGAFEARHRDA